MSNRVKSTGRWALAAVVLAVLAFGAERAFAEPAALACQDDGWNFLGSKPSPQACFDACFALHPDLVQARWVASTGCCTCLF